MQETRDESNRISRLSSDAAKEYLIHIKGKAYEEYRSAWEICGKRQQLLDYPLQLNIELTASCNLRCCMCYRSYDMETGQGFLNLLEIEKIASQFAVMNIPSLWLSGGEPLLHPKIKDILVTFGKIKPIDFWMVSNGLLLTEDLAEAIIDSGMTWLSISIDSANSETYKKIRGGNYERLLSNIDTFLKVRERKESRLPFLRVSFIKMSENKGEEQQFISLWKDKADIIDFQTLADYHDLDRFTEEDVFNSDYVCTAPFTLLSIVSNGDLIPCCNGFYREKSTYNINNTSLQDYWNSTYHNSFAASIRNKDYCDECIKCVKSFLPRK